LIARYFYGMMLFETGQIRLMGFFARVLIASGLVLGMNVIIALLSKGVAEAILVTDIAGTAMSGGQPYNHLWIFATYLKSPPHDLGVLIFFLLAPFSILGLFFILISNWLRLGIALFVVGVSPIWVISLLTDRQMKLFISGLNLMMRLYMVPLATLVLLLGLFMFSKTMGFNPGHQTSILDVGAVVMTCLYMIFVAIVPWFLAKYIGAVPAKAIAAAVTRTQEAADAQGSTWLDSKGLGSGREKAGITAQSADETATAAAARLALASRTGPGGPGRGQGEGEGETFGRDPRLGPGGPGGPGGGPGGPSGPGGGLRGASSADDEEKPRNPAEELAGVSDKTARGALAKGDEAPAASSEDAAPALGEGIPKPKTKEATTGEIAKAVDDEAAELAAGDQEKAAGLPAGDKEEAAELAAGDQEKAAGGGLKELGPGEKRDPLTEIAEPSKLTDSAKAGDPKAAAETSLDSYKANPTRQDLPKSKGRRGLEKLGGFVANSAKFVGTGAVQDVKSEYISALRHQGNVFKAAGFLGTVTGSEFVARHPAGEYKRAAKEVAHFNSPAGVQARLNMPQNVRAKQQYDQAAKTIQRFKENPPMEVMTARRMSALKQALTTAGSPQEALKIQKDMAELQSDVLKNNPEYARAMTMQQQAIAMARPSSQDAALIARYQQIVASTKADGGPGTHWEAWTDSALVNDIKDRGQAWVGDFQADMAQWQAGQRSGFANNDLFVRFAGSSAKAGGQIQTQMLTQNKEWANQAKTRQAALERSQKDMVALGTVKARAETTRSNRAQLISDLGQNTVNSQAGMYARLGPLAQSGNVAQMNEEIERQRHVEMGNLHQATKPIEEQMYKQFDTVIPAIAGSTKPADWAARAPEIERQLPVEQQPVFHQLVKQRQAAAAPYTRRLDALEETAVRLADPTQLPVMRQEIVTKYGAAVSSAADVAHQVTAQAENIIYDVSAARVKNDRGAEREAMARQEKLLLSVNDPEARQRLSGLIGQSIEDETELMRTETAAQRSYREATTAQGAPALYHAIHLGDTVSSFRKSSQVQAAESLRNQRIAERGANAQAALESYQAELPHLRQQAASGDERAKEALSETETSIATAQRIIDGVAARERANELGTQATRNLRAQSVVEARKDLARQEERLNAQRAAEENAEVLYNKMLASQARGTADGAAITRTYQRLQDQKTRTQKELDLWREKQEDVELLNNGDIREPKRSTPPTVISPEKAKTEEKEKEKEAKRMQGDVKEMNTEDQQREAARQAAIEEQRQQDAISLAETQHEQEEARKAEDARVAAVKAAQNLPPTQALPPTKNVAQFDPAAHAAEAEARQAEQEAEARRKQAHEESVTRQAEATRKVEEAKKAEEARVTEEARKAEEARQAEITRLAEVERQRVETEKQAEIDRQVAATQKAAEEAAAAKKAVDEAETAERAKVEKARQAEVERRLEAGRAVETSRWNQLSFGERRETMYNNGAVQNAYEIQIKAIDDYEQRLRAKYEGIMEAEQPEEGSKWWNMFHDHLTMKLDEVEGLRRETQVNFEGGGLPPQQQITAFQRRTREIEGMNW
jgi:hypothetical protein